MATVLTSWQVEFDSWHKAAACADFEDLHDEQVASFVATGKFDDSAWVTAGRTDETAVEFAKKIRRYNIIMDNSVLWRQIAVALTSRICESTTFQG